MSKLARLIHILIVISMLLPWGTQQAVAAWLQQDDSTGIYRTRVSLPLGTSRARLDALGVLVLDEGEDWALVLVEQGLLETLARLGFQPSGSNELGMLVAAHTWDKPWLADSLQATLQMLRQAVVDESASPLSLVSFTPEQLEALRVITGVDDDGDGLSNTEESWWCTDPSNPNTDQDAGGYADGEEVTALLDFTQPRAVRWGYGPPFGPPAAWPDFNGADGNSETPACNDGDFDTIPDFAEVYMVGSRVPSETTDGDKFDDGQELYGVTYCPGGITSCDYGSYPRQEYWNYIKETMPNWVLPPGDNIFVAAFPVPEVSVVPGSWTVNRVTVITTEEGQMSQTTHSYETSVMRGQSTSIADTVTWNNWEEVSQAVERPLQASHISNNPLSCPPGDTGCRIWGGVKIVGGALGIAGGCLTPIGALSLGWSCYLGAAGGSVAIVEGFSDLLFTDKIQGQMNLNQYDNSTNIYDFSQTNVSTSYEENTFVSLNQQFEDQRIVQSLDSVQYAINQQGVLMARGLQDISYQISRPRYTETHTSGQSWGGSQTVTNEVYEEHTISEGQAFTSGYNWSTAWAVDSSHAADLTFNFVVQNTGTEYAREITGMVFNVYLGDDTTPIVSYPAWEQFPNGKLENVFPGDTHSFASTNIPLTLDQMRRIDLGERLIVVLEDYSYGADELFYQDAVNGGVTFFIEDGVEDGDETVDYYVVPTWGTESVQDVLTRYLPAGVDNDGNLNSLWTPEFDGINPPAWNEHFLSEIAWWNLYLTQTDAGDSPLHELPAQAGSALLFRFNRDSDRDGYQDRVELKHYCSLSPLDPDNQYCGVAQERADIHPQPEVLAGYVATREGQEVTVLLKVANLGNFDAYGIDAVMYAPDDTVTIGNNTVGGNGRVRPGEQVAVGSLVLPPDLSNWSSSTSDMYAAGNFQGSQDITYTFSVATPGVIGQSGTSLDWTDTLGNSGTLNVGSTYHAPLPIDVANGLQLGFDTGTAMVGDSFFVAALTPRDTFTYTINSEPFTPPVIVLSYSDPQGSRRLITPVELTSLSDDLTCYRGEMLPEAGLALVSTDELDPTGNNTTYFTFNSPHPSPIQGANLHLNFVSDGQKVAEVTEVLDLQPGPTVYPVDWSTDIFTQTFDPEADNILIAFWTDAQENIIDSAARPLNTFQEDARAEANLSSNTWDFGTVTLGTVLEHEITLANTGLALLQAYISGADAELASPYLTIPPATYQVFHLTLDTATLGTGAYNTNLTVRTSDPDHPEYTIVVTGYIEPLAAQALAQTADENQPWNQLVYVPGPHNQNDTITFDHVIGDSPERIHPLYVYTEDGGMLLGVGEYGPDFTGQTAPFGIFGDGSDGDLTVQNGETIYTDNIRSALAATAASGQPNLVLSSANDFVVGQEVIIIQMQGNGAGSYEFGIISTINANTLTLQDNLKNNYPIGGTSKGQVIRIPHYQALSVLSGGIISAHAWDGSTGGVVIFRSNQTVSIETSASVTTSGKGFSGGIMPNSGWTSLGNTGESQLRSSIIGSSSPNGGGGGGGCDYQNAGGSGGSYGTEGTNGGGNQCANNHKMGYIYGDEFLTASFLGSGGGSSGGCCADGGAGGGSIFIFAKDIFISGNLTSNGANGQNGGSNPGGGAGSGGSIKITGQSLELGNEFVTALGGIGGSSSGMYGGQYTVGGNGGKGRIRIEYCNSLTGTTNPPASTQQITCYITRQLSGNPNTELILPGEITDYSRYQLQYGQRGTFTGFEGTTDYSIALSKRIYSSATLDALFENLGNSSFNFSLDIGADGSVEWTGSGNEQPIILPSPALADGLNTYLASIPDDWGAEVAVPIRVTLDTTGDIFLTNIYASTGGDSDPSISNGDLSASDTTPMETDLVTLYATVHNTGHLPAQHVIASFFAGDPQANGIYLGSAYLPSIAPGGSAQASVQWDTTGYSGGIDVYVVLDTGGQIAEMNEENNTAVLPISVQARPDLHVTSIEQQGSARQTMEVEVLALVHNSGGTDAGQQTVALYDGDPANGGQIIDIQTVAVGAGMTETVSFIWLPDSLGPRMLFAQADLYEEISEFDETNNLSTLSTYVGWGPPLYIDVAGDGDQPYDAMSGYGYLTEGWLQSCGPEPYQTYRETDDQTPLQYQFNHLLPERFYHLDLAVYSCDTDREMSVLVDGVPVTGTLTASNEGPSYLSILLDPSFYADHQVILSLEKAGLTLGGPVVSQLMLTDIRYCYRDSGNSEDVSYAHSQDACGWLDGKASQGWGTLPYQSVRYDTDGSVYYQYDWLEGRNEYMLHFTFFEADGQSRVENVTVDGVTVLSNIILSDTPQRYTITLPPSVYGDGTIQVVIGGTGQPVISEITLEQKTIPEGGGISPPMLIAFLPMVRK